MSIDWLAFFKKSQDSLKGYIKPAELIKALGLALTAGGGFAGFLGVLAENMHTFVIDPVALLNIQAIISDASAKNWLAVVLGSVTFIISIYRKFNKGAVILNPATITESKAVVVETVVQKSPEELRESKENTIF